MFCLISFCHSCFLSYFGRCQSIPYLPSFQVSCVYECLHLCRIFFHPPQSVSHLTIIASCPIFLFVLAFQQVFMSICNHMMSCLSFGSEFVVAQHFVRNTFLLVHEYEKLSRKTAGYRNHLRFNLRGRQSRLIPRSWCLGSTVKGHRASQILSKAQPQLLNERIRQVHFTVNAPRDKIHQAEEKPLAFPHFYP